ncbi:MAG TPA: hypothetical protein VN969_24905 [Streptosporangiaceae bacterium]|nr:hypothetical protein [Streptosporangiaceae bacterium]
MQLTQDSLHGIALEARGGLRECLNMIELHARDRERSFLNPGIVLTAAATWERFMVDVCHASEKAAWTLEDSGWKRGYDASVPWPGGSKDRNREGRGQDQQEHHVDGLLIRNGVLTEPLTSLWTLHVATGWFGADPTEWRRADYAARPYAENRDIIRAAMLGAKSARDAAAHRLYYKKAQQARLVRQDGEPDEDADQRDWCYVWQSDNPGKPTIQHGYARGVVALVIQLVDITVATIREHQGWAVTDSQLPSAWFRQKIPSGTCAGMELWGGHELWRA